MAGAGARFAVAPEHPVQGRRLAFARSSVELNSYNPHFPPRILVVEDECTAIDYLKKGSSESGLVVVTAYRGEDGLHPAAGSGLAAGARLVWSGRSVERNGSRSVLA
jgi:hypothetical protein